MKPSKLFTIRETARTCNIGRTTLQRLTDEKLVEPAYMGENSYHYYNVVNIYNISLIQILKSCGIYGKRLEAIGSSTESLTAVRDELRDKVNILTFALDFFGMMADPEEAGKMRILHLPESKTFSYKSPEPVYFGDIPVFLEEIICDFVKRGLTLSSFYPPFVQFDSTDAVEYNGKYPCYRVTGCLVLGKESRDKEIISLPAIEVITVAFKYSAEKLTENYHVLLDEIERTGHVKAGPPRMETLFTPFARTPEYAEESLLRLSIPIDKK